MALTLNTRRGKWYASGTILQATGTLSGNWEHVDGVYPVTVTVDGGGSWTVTLYATNATTAPTDADSLHGVLATFTNAPGTYVINAPFEFIKAAATAFISGSVTVLVQAAPTA